MHLENLNFQWKEILSLGDRCLFPKHHAEPGHRERGFFYIQKGWVRLSCIGAAGQERSALYMGQGCLFNETPVLGTVEMPSLFICVEPVEAWRFDAALLEDTAFIAKYPHLIANIMQSLARKASLFFGQMGGMAFSSSMSQLCAMLLQLANARSPRMTQGELASVLGLHMTTVARLVRSLRDEGTLGKFTKTELEILDMDRLRVLAQRAEETGRGR